MSQLASAGKKAKKAEAKLGLGESAKIVLDITKLAQVNRWNST